MSVPRPGVQRVHYQHTEDTHALCGAGRVAASWPILSTDNPDLVECRKCVRRLPTLGDN